jgi:hypothetical protein
MTDVIFCRGTIFCRWFGEGRVLHQAGVHKRPGKPHYRYYYEADE